jgi:hypothetical protein
MYKRIIELLGNAGYVRDPMLEPIHAAQKEYPEIGSGQMREIVRTLWAEGRVTPRPKVVKVNLNPHEQPTFRWEIPTEEEQRMMPKLEPFHPVN